METNFKVGSEITIKDLETGELIPGTIGCHYRFGQMKQQFIAEFTYRDQRFMMCFSKKTGLGYGPSMMKSKVQAIINSVKN